MSQLIYRAEDGSLKIGRDSYEPELTAAVYRTTADKRIFEREGVFVEVRNDGSGERTLFAADK